MLISIKIRQDMTKSQDSFFNRLSVQIIVLFCLLFIVLMISLGSGRYSIDYMTVFSILMSNLLEVQTSWKMVEERIVELVRLPRILVAGFVGAGLAISGAALQGMFRNPLVGPKIIGVSAGAGFGGVLAMLFGLTGTFILGFATIFGIVAIACTLFIARSGHNTSLLALVLGGVVTGGFFTAMISLVKFTADPDDILPEIVYWLLGSFNESGYSDALYISIPLLLAGTIVYKMRHTINVLSLGEEEAHTLGINVKKSRWVLMIMTAIIVAACVSVSGVIGWVGLIIPHFARMVTGSNHARLIPVSALIGAIYMISVDTIARTASYGEIPVGILTALVGAPIFAWLLHKIGAGKLKNA